MVSPETWAPQAPGPSGALWPKQGKCHKQHPRLGRAQAAESPALDQRPQAFSDNTQALLSAWPGPVLVLVTGEAGRELLEAAWLADPKASLATLSLGPCSWQAKGSPTR